MLNGMIGAMPMTRKSDLEFKPSLQLFSQSRADNPITILAGPNNGGKSLTLKWLKATLGRSAYFIGTNRFYHVYRFSTGLREPNELDQLESSFQSNYQQEDYNYEQNVFDLNRIIIGLSDTRRSELFSLCGKLIGNSFSMKKLDEENDLSPRYIDMDGQNLSVSSSGTRLLMTMLGICMDDRFSALLIDEPELGLSPRLQQTLSTFLQDETEREQYFPHLKRVFIATHSHLFLSHGDIASNYVVTKQGKAITLSRIQNIGDFHRLQFNLLGNAFETMFFPSAIVIVEGKTDHLYLERVLQLRFAERRVTVISGGGDVKRKVHGLREALGDLEKSPFRARLLVVLDKVHQPDLCAELEKMGVFSRNIVKWSRNGIEFIYPQSILASIYSCAATDVSNLSLNGDLVSLNGINKTKNELANEVISRLDSSTPLPDELEKNLLKLIEDAIS
jgi:predicted ATPase